MQLLSFYFSFISHGNWRPSHRKRSSVVQQQPRQLSVSSTFIIESKEKVMYISIIRSAACVWWIFKHRLKMAIWRICFLFFSFYFVHVICKLFCISRFNDPNLSSALTQIFSYLFKSFFFLEKVELFVELIEPLRKNRLWNVRFNALIAHIMDFNSHRTKFLPR